MTQDYASTSIQHVGMDETIMISRRGAVSSAALVLLSLLADSAFGQEEISEEAMQAARERRRRLAEEAGRQGREAAFQRMLERSPEMRAFYEQAGSGATVEERVKAMQDWQRRQAMENLKKQLGVSEEEWTVVQPRLETVHFLRTPPMSFAPEDTCASAVVSRLRRELSELVNNKETTPDQIKAKLTALRSAKEKVRQELAKAREELRKIVTVRQEAILVLSDLLV